MFKNNTPVFINAVSLLSEGKQELRDKNYQEVSVMLLYIVTKGQQLAR
jgi:hypothetical protein